MVWDCLIVGGGPAGLSAALVLGRCRRRALVCDTGRPRNRSSGGLHGFLTRDGLVPIELLAIARRQLAPYDTVELRPMEVIDARRRGADAGFTATLADGTSVDCRTMLLTTGVVDELPDVPGLAPLYGKSVFHCPYCDGWEMRDQPLAVYGRGEKGLRLALKLTLWSDDLVLCTDGAPPLSRAERKRLAAHAIAVRQEPIARLESRRGRLERIVFKAGEPLERRGLFFNTGQRQHSDLARKLGCRMTRLNSVRTDKRECTNIPGLYAAGDASRDVQLAIVAAAEGAKAAFAINEALLDEEL